MWKLLAEGEPVDVDGMVYTVQAIEPGRIYLTWRAAKLEHGVKMAGYPTLADGQEVAMRYGDQERRGRVVTVRAGVIEVGPAAMVEAQDGNTCPYCWFDPVPGKPTGVRSGFGAGPNLAATRDIEQFTCPGCASEFTTAEWGDMARRLT